METSAVIFDAPGSLEMRKTALTAMESGDVRVEIHYSGISTGTEKLLWTGQMPAFPGMGYPLIPGYESVGRIVDALRKHSFHRIFPAWRRRNQRLQKRPPNVCGNHLTQVRLPIHL